MTRKKVKLQYITNDASRKATFKKRKKGLMKKVSELSTLCGVDACAIIYSAFEPQPEVWPSQMGAKNVLARFKGMSEMEQSKKMVNQESFLRQRISKIREQVKKEHKENREMEITEVTHQCLAGKSLNLGVMDWHDVAWMADQNLKEVNKRIETLKKAEQRGSRTQQPGSSKGKATATAGANGDKVGVSGSTSTNLETTATFDQQVNENINRQQWLMDLVNPQEPMGYTGDEQMMLSFADGNHPPPAALWSNAYFPWEK